MSAADDEPGAEAVLAGGLANAGAVRRRGVAVVRPAPPHAPAVHEFLRALRATGFHGAPLPRRLLDDGTEELEFLHGDVPVPPLPLWALHDGALDSVGRLLRAFHDASARVGVPQGSWPADFADPAPGPTPIVLHGDTSPDNVVFRDGRAVAFIDWDFAAPGRPEWDLALLARYWVPLLDPESARVSYRDHLDTTRRLRVLADAYGLAAEARPGFVAVCRDATAVCRRFVAARVEAGIPSFVAAFEANGGWPRWDRVEAWLEAGESRMTAALLA